jgi:hypothetical protein
MDHPGSSNLRNLMLRKEWRGDEFHTIFLLHMGKNPVSSINMEKVNRDPFSRGNNT